MVESELCFRLEWYVDSCMNMSELGKSVDLFHLNILTLGLNICDYASAVLISDRKLGVRVFCGDRVVLGGI